jgi:glycosyltransferase involved in cell wall biosynthesis
VGRQHGRAALVTVRDYWPVCLHGTSWWGGRDCEGCSTPNLTSCMQEYWRWPQPVARLMIAWARRRLRARGVALSDAHAVLAVSHAVLRRLERDLPDAPLSVVPNMVDPAVVQAAAASAPDFDIASPYLLTAGKLEPTKGFDLLLRALGEIGKTPTLVVAGEGSMRDALERQADALHLPARFLGWVSHDRLLRLQERAHAVVLPSAWAEPLSRIVLETMALGVPVVAWARGGNPEMIEPGVSGWLVGRPNDLAEAMRQLGSDERRREVGRAAQARVTTCYSPDVVYPAVASAYERALVKAGRH